MCNATKVVETIQNILIKAKPFLFPTKIKVTKSVSKNVKNQKDPKANGGWSDHRDQALCLKMASTNSTCDNDCTLEFVKNLTKKLDTQNKIDFPV